jgi:hypothetical protein
MSLEQENQPSVEDYEKLKMEKKFLTLTIKRCNKRYKSLRASYNDLLARVNAGIKVVGNDDEPMLGVSTFGYARKRHLNNTIFSKRLQEAGITYMHRGVTYIKNPVAHGHLVFYKKQLGIRGGIILRLYWNTEGVEFLNEFVRTHYAKEPMCEFSF